jgi:hypothetical protein
LTPWLFVASLAHHPLGVRTRVHAAVTLYAIHFVLVVSVDVIIVVLVILFFFFFFFFC